MKKSHSLTGTALIVVREIGALHGVTSETETINHAVDVLFRLDKAQQAGGNLFLQHKGDPLTDMERITVNFDPPSRLRRSPKSGERVGYSLTGVALQKARAIGAAHGLLEGAVVRRAIQVLHTLELETHRETIVRLQHGGDRMINAERLSVCMSHPGML